MQSAGTAAVDRVLVEMSSSIIGLFAWSGPGEVVCPGEPRY